jgi:hypothetical protein
MIVAQTALILDFLEWIAAGPRTYQEAMAAWQTSCPQLSIWEDSMAAGYIARETDAEHRPSVRITALGRRFLEQHHRPVTPRDGC